MSVPESPPAEVENQNHRYVTNAIPWFVHLLWLLFWMLAIWYVLSFLFPAMRAELVSPP